MIYVVLITTNTLKKSLGELYKILSKIINNITFDILNQYVYMKNKELSKLANIHFNNITKIRKVVDIPKQKKQELVV